MSCRADFLQKKFSLNAVFPYRHKSGFTLQVQISALFFGCFFEYNNLRFHSEDHITRIRDA